VNFIEFFTVSSSLFERFSFNFDFIGCTQYTNSIYLQSFTVNWFVFLKMWKMDIIGFTIGDE